MNSSPFSLWYFCMICFWNSKTIELQIKFNMIVWMKKKGKYSLLFFTSNDSI
ncbi:putative signal peptide protein [Puccinia sorghi]|uniref:Putative signal peptide protein n=1 Tax=Puccinia sorghi TaxID=27349 RepID=A0A0L6VR76_9BASI|nr:putative signal peptide protein [Puccinia sorghi]